MWYREPVKPHKALTKIRKETSRVFRRAGGAVLPSSVYWVIKAGLLPEVHDRPQFLSFGRWWCYRFICCNYAFCQRAMIFYFHFNIVEFNCVSGKYIATEWKCNWNYFVQAHINYVNPLQESGQLDSTVTESSLWPPYRGSLYFLYKVILIW